MKAATFLFPSMAGNALEWFPWYWKDWRLSESYARFGPQERGIYRDLLDECWGTGSFPLDFAYIGRICGCSPEVAELGWGQIAHKFEKRSDGRYFNRQMQEIRAAQVQKHQSLVERGRRGGKEKASRAKAKLQPSSSPTLQIERQKDSLSRGQNGAALVEQARRLPELQKPDSCRSHDDGSWGKKDGRDYWFCRVCH